MLLSAGTGALGGFALFIHEVSAQRSVRGMLIVGPAKDTEVVDDRFSSMGHRNNVIELEAAARAAAFAAFAHERTSMLIASPDDPADVRRNVTWVGACFPSDNK